MPLEPGKYVFHASYISNREENGKDNLKPWSGPINSKPGFPGGISRCGLFSKSASAPAS